ncbi:hypothetical protein KZ774_00680 [Escherichia coli]|nr:hypothetical protein [Escherichia coli]
MRDLINWSETDEKSRHGLPPIAHQVAKSTPVVDNGKIVRAEAAQGENQPGYPVSEGLLWLGFH